MCLPSKKISLAGKNSGGKIKGTGMKIAL